MKILIIYATAGAGHKKAAEAIFDEIKSKTSHEVSIVDSLDYTNPFFKFIYSQGYIFLISRLPSFWGFFYRLTDSPPVFGLISFLRNLYNLINSQKLSKFLLEQNPQIIISTHFFINQVVSRIKKSVGLNCRLISVITDFEIHPFWLGQGVDVYTVANQELKDDLIARGVAENKIIISGIPVKRNFFHAQDRKELCKKLNINPNSFTALIVTGTIGIGPIEKIIEVLKDNVQLIVVCGENKGLFKKLNRIKDGSLKLFGLVGNMHELMSVSDVIVTKAGGLTISEALAKGLPMVFFNLIPGQETYNAKLMERLGAGVITRNVKQIKEAVLRLKNNPQELRKLKENIRLNASPQASDKIIELLK